MPVKQDPLMLPWTSGAQENRYYRWILCIFLLLLLVLSVWVPLIDLPEPDRETLEKLPPQLAKIVLKKEKPKPLAPKLDDAAKKEIEEKPPEPVKKEEKKKPEIDKKPPPKPQTKPDPKPKMVDAKKVAKAREAAKKTGLLALQDDLSELKSAVDLSRLSKTSKIRKEATIAAKAQGLVTDKVLAGSSGIDTDALAAPAEQVALETHQSAQLDATQDERDLALAEAEAARKTNQRSRESILYTNETLKEPLFKLYNRALRQDPFLEGKVVLEVVIEPDGSVSSCRIVSSELGNKALEAKLVNRVRLANYGAEAVAQVTVNIPFDFHPK